MLVAEAGATQVAAVQRPAAEAVTSRATACRASCHSLYVELEEENVAILDDIVLAL
jgi:hypothetical protein